MSYITTESANVITNPNNAYASLDTYNMDNIIGPPISPIVPSMHYIQLPQEHMNYGYDALSHDYNGIGYYNVTTGYGNKCTTFELARCPSNRAMSCGGAPGTPGGAPSGAPAGAPSAAGCPVTVPSTREGYSQPLVYHQTTAAPMQSVQKTIKDLDIEVFLDTKNCPHSQSMMKMLEQHGLVHLVTIYHVNNPEIRNMLIQKGGNGVPFLYSKTSGAHLTGMPPHLNALVNTLNTKKQPVTPSLNPEVVEKLKQLDIVVYTTDSCHYCKLYKQFIYSQGLRPHIKMIDVNNKADTMNDDFLKTNQLTAYPFTVSKSLRTSFPGLPKSVDEIFVLLTNQST